MKKCDRESVHRRTHTHTHARTNAKRFYYLSHAICYSYGADNNFYAHDEVIYTAEHLQVLWPCAPFAPPSGKCSSWVYGSGAFVPTSINIYPYSFFSATYTLAIVTPNCRYCADCAQNLPGLATNIGSTLFHIFHRNRFTFGGVIAERVKTVLLPWRVFPWFASKAFEANNNIQVPTLVHILVSFRQRQWFIFAIFTSPIDRILYVSNIEPFVSSIRAYSYNKQVRW